MKAYRMTAFKTAPQMVEIPIPEPAAGQVRIKLGGAGICQSDLHIIHRFDASMPRLNLWKFPFTLGHENAGWIDALGPGVKNWSIGDKVVVGPAGCGRCKHCITGQNNYCLDPNRDQHPGLGADGGLAEFMLARADALVPINRLEPWQAASLTDAGMTSYHAVKRVLPLLTPDATVVVIGIGGLGHFAVSILEATTSARVVAVDSSEQARDLALQLGAELALPSDDDARTKIREFSGGAGASAVLDFVGVDATLTLAARTIRQLGSIIAVGLGGGHLDFRVGATLPWGASISTGYGGSRADLTEVVALAEAGRINPHLEKYPFSEVEDALAKLQKGEIVGRAVMVPDSELATTASV